MVEEELPVLKLDLLEAVHHQVGYSLELTIKGERTLATYNYGNLRFACWKAVRVDISSLELSEEQFTGGSIIRMRPSEKDGYIQAFKELHGRIAGVVWCVVQKNHRVLPPALPLRVQLKHQLPEEYVHDLCIGVRLQQAQVDLALIV